MDRMGVNRAVEWVTGISRGQGSWWAGVICESA